MCVCVWKWFFTLTNKQKASNSAKKKKGCNLKNGESTKRENSSPIQINESSVFMMGRAKKKKVLL